MSMLECKGISSYSFFWRNACSAFAAFASALLGYVAGAASASPLSSISILSCNISGYCIHRGGIQNQQSLCRLIRNSRISSAITPYFIDNALLMDMLIVAITLDCLRNSMLWMNNGMFFAKLGVRKWTRAPSMNFESPSPEELGYLSGSPKFCNNHLTDFSSLSSITETWWANSPNLSNDRFLRTHRMPMYSLLPGSGRFAWKRPCKGQAPVTNTQRLEAWQMYQPSVTNNRGFVILTK